MPGKPRTLEWCISQYGEVEGPRRFAVTLERRTARELRAANDRSLKPTLTPESVEAGDAIRCHGCGVILTRLQWTHFKSSCKMKSLAEYRAIYPDAPLVASNLAKMTAVTRDGLIQKYGADEGEARYAQYRTKQANSNSFSYKAERHGWDRDRFDAFNASRAVTFTNLVERWGKEEGAKRWAAYCDRQSFTNTLEFFCEREGDKEQGLQAWLAYNDAKGKSRRVPDIASDLGISLEEAEVIFSERMATMGKYVSDGERQFVAALEEALGEEIRYSHKTKQFCIWSHEASRPFLYDACCSRAKKIVEFHGDYWHCRPGRYDASFLVRQRGMTAAEIWALDALKAKVALDRGFDLRVIWESDFRKTTDMTEIARWFRK